ncbi:MAG: alpha/beta hydrolase-fold protein [Rhodomicrobium sp.]
MIRIACAFIAFFAWQSTLAFAGQVRSESLASKTLGHDMPFLIYLPDGYEAGRLHYPVLYLLHGAGGNERSWLDMGHIKEKADSLIAKGTIPPALIVMPGCPGCWWVDGAKEKAETAFWSDLVPAIDLRYRTIATRGGRLIAGLSAGGYGAVRFGLRHSESIAAVAALSPAIYADTVPQLSAARTQPPFLGPDGKFSQTAWDQLNYPNLLDQYFDKQNRVPFYLVSADGDKFGIAFETALLFKRLFQRQPEKVELRVVDGDHSWKVWEAAIDNAMEYLFRYTDHPKPPAQTAGLSPTSH